MMLQTQNCGSKIIGIFFSRGFCRFIIYSDFVKLAEIKILIKTKIVIVKKNGKLCFPFFVFKAVKSLNLFCEGLLLLSRDSSKCFC